MERDSPHEAEGFFVQAVKSGGAVAGQDGQHAHTILLQLLPALTTQARAGQGHSVITVKAFIV